MEISVANQPRRVLLVIAGGIAAYKSLELIRRLKERGVAVRCVLTPAAREFVTPLSVGALSGDTVYGDLFDLTDEAQMGHIQLSRSADLVVVAPATADLLARMATGRADDLASTVLLATDKKVLVAPAMNVRMWNHPATQRNLATLRRDGVLFVGPNDGDMACGEYGPGRLAEPDEIAAAVMAELGRGDGPLAGRRILITSGPTREPIDPVRYISNHSSGKQGHAIASALAELGARVLLVSGPVALPDPPGIETLHVESAREMLAACEAACEASQPLDAAIFAAAVADWRVAGEARQKMKKDGQTIPALTLTENPDILHTVSHHPTARPRLVVGFAAETENLLRNADAKRRRKGCDWLVANDVGTGTGTFGGDENSVLLLTEDGVEDWPKLTKAEVARRLARRIAEHLAVEGS